MALMDVGAGSNLPLIQISGLEIFVAFTNFPLWAKVSYGLRFHLVSQENEIETGQVLLERADAQQDFGFTN